MQSIKALQELVNQQLENLEFPDQPASLYEPIKYILKIGGKRIRPVLTLLGSQMFGGKESEALYSALAVEVFHNFTLLHDDLMDQAPLRRNQQTVHELWNANTAILSGDAMLIQAYALLSQSSAGHIPDLVIRFNTMAMDVCRGQQLDMEFEKHDGVGLSEYLNMIRLKTAVLIGTSLELGALTAGASEQNAAKLYAFGEAMGIAFQLQDDYLDAFGNPKTFGKQLGGDILANKKTYLLVQALTSGDFENIGKLRFWMDKSTADPDEKIRNVLHIYRAMGIDAKALTAVKTYSEKAHKALDGVGVEDAAKTPLRRLCQSLIDRTT